MGISNPVQKAGNDLADHWAKKGAAIHRAPRPVVHLTKLANKKVEIACKWVAELRQTVHGQWSDIGTVPKAGKRKVQVRKRKPALEPEQ
eukprot:3074594-Karenia_brevis.AAC.1